MSDVEWVDEPVECGFCGFVVCACDELNDVYEAQMDMIDWDDQ